MQNRFLYYFDDNEKTKYRLKKSKLLPYNFAKKKKKIVHI